LTISLNPTIEVLRRGRNQ